MSDYLMRDGAPLDGEGWKKVDQMVADVAKKNLTARRFVPLVGPLGWGVDKAPVFGFEQTDGSHVASDTPVLADLGEIKETFMLRAKHLAMANASPFGLDLGAVAIAATSVSKAEDQAVFEGLLGSDGALSAELGDWDTLGGPFKAVAAAIASLRAAGFDGPYATVMDPAMYARLAALMQHGRREIDLVGKSTTAGLFHSTAMPNDKVLVTSPQAWNYDLVVGQDIATAYLGNEGLDHLFQVFETVALRVKRPQAICVLG